MRKAIIITLILISPLLSLAQKPNISNAKLQEVSASQGLEPAFDAIVQRQDSPAWIGYRISSVGKGTMCCFDSRDQSQNSDSHCCMGCSMESGHSGSFNGTVSGCTQPEPSHYSFVFFRVEGRKVMKIRNYSLDCALDFGGLPLYWMENVDPGQSIALLSKLSLADAAAEPGREEGLANSALMAIALHDDPAADQALEKLMRPDQPELIRERTSFWLAVERGKRGLETLQKYAKDDNERLREKIVFAFSISKQPEAIPDLISMARNDPSSRVRGQALFWMGQIGGRKVAQQISQAIEDDPETAVKKRAVFALAQMKDGEGVPLLINLAKTNKNPVVRKEAVRWLGMTNDPRALDFLAEILTK